MSIMNILDRYGHKNHYQLAIIGADAAHYDGKLLFALRRWIERMVVCDVTEFLLGTDSSFTKEAAVLVRRAKEKYPEIRLKRAHPYEQREKYRSDRVLCPDKPVDDLEKWMIDQSNGVLFFYPTEGDPDENSRAWELMNYASMHGKVVYNVPQALDEPFITRCFEAVSPELG